MHDCGVFVAADISELAKTGKLYAFDQPYIIDFRKEIIAVLESLDQRKPNEKDAGSFIGQLMLPVDN
jgi:hypothetical protein